MTLEQAVEMVFRGETPEQYKKRIERIKRLANERDDLMDAIEVLGDDPRAIRKQKRAAKVVQMIERLEYPTSKGVEK